MGGRGRWCAAWPPALGAPRAPGASAMRANWGIVHPASRSLPPPPLQQQSIATAPAVLFCAPHREPTRRASRNDRSGGVALTTPDAACPPPTVRPSVHAVGGIRPERPRGAGMDILAAHERTANQPPISLLLVKGPPLGIAHCTALTSATHGGAQASLM